MTVFEIETEKGTVCYFKVKADIKANDITITEACDVADEEDDYLFETKDNLIRIQVIE